MPRCVSAAGARGTAAAARMAGTLFVEKRRGESGCPPGTPSDTHAAGPGGPASHGGAYAARCAAVGQTRRRRHFCEHPACLAAGCAPASDDRTTCPDAAQGRARPGLDAGRLRERGGVCRPLGHAPRRHDLLLQGRLRPQLRHQRLVAQRRRARGVRVRCGDTGGDAPRPGRHGCAARPRAAAVSAALSKCIYGFGRSTRVSNTWWSCVAHASLMRLAGRLGPSRVLQQWRLALHCPSLF